MSKLIKSEQLETKILPPIKTYIDNHSIPSGGTTGQVLAKKSNTNGDVEWKNVGGGGSPAYSTEERKIGTYLGYDLYEITLTNITIQAPATGSAYRDYNLNNKSIPNSYTIVDYEGRAIGIDDSYTYLIPSSQASEYITVLSTSYDWVIRNAMNQVILIRALTLRYTKENL